MRAVQCFNGVKFPFDILKNSLHELIVAGACRIDPIGCARLKRGMWGLLKVMYGDEEKRFVK